MANLINSAAGEPVRRYLLSLARHTGSQPEKIPAERDLAELLGVARGTVRDAIASLEEQNFLIRLPGRKGAFTNPKLADTVTLSIGVLTSVNWFDRRHQQTLRGFSDVLFENDIDYSFHMELTGSIIDRRLIQTIRHSGYSLLLNLCEDCIQDKAIRDIGIPVIDYRRDVLSDEVHAGHLIADFFLKRGCRKVIYWCPDTNRYCHFQERMLENQAECLHETPDQVGRAEQVLTRNRLKEADGMFLGHNPYNISNMLEFLSAAKVKFPVLLPPSLGQQEKLKDYSGLNLHLMNLKFLDDAHLQAGRQLGNYALELLRDPLAKPAYAPIRYYKLQNAGMNGELHHEQNTKRASAI